MRHRRVRELRLHCPARGASALRSASEQHAAWRVEQRSESSRMQMLPCLLAMSCATIKHSSRMAIAEVTPHDEQNSAM
eukprot:658138-Amphidinium_carterae.1